MKINQIIIAGGVHGDETTGIALARYFTRENFSKIKAILCHEQAIKARVRYFETDLNRSFSKEMPVSLEERLACKIKEQMDKDSIILDFHNTKAFGTTSAIVVQKPNKLQLFLASYFGFKRIVQMLPSNSLIAENPSRAIAFEVANNEKHKFPVLELREKIKQLVEFDFIESTKPLNEYSYLTKIKRKTVKRLNFKLSKIKNFKRLTVDQKHQLGLPVDRVFCPIFYKTQASEETSFTVVEEKKR